MNDRKTSSSIRRFNKKLLGSMKTTSSNGPPLMHNISVKSQPRPQAPTQTRGFRRKQCASLVLLVRISTPIEAYCAFLHSVHRGLGTSLAVRSESKRLGTRLVKSIYSIVACKSAISTCEPLRFIIKTGPLFSL